MNDFFSKDKFFSRSFIKMNNNLKPQTVVVEMMDGAFREYSGILNGWRYIAKCKKNPEVKNAWIKSE